MIKKIAGLSFLLLLLAASLSGQQPGIATSQSPHGNLNVPCANCHTAQGWKPIRAVPEFDHNQTKYPLRGMHVGVACTACHVKPVFTDVGKKCADCHADIHKHQLGSNCEQCHSVRGWNVAIKDIEAHNNRFPLTGAHAAVDCDACHKNAANSKFETMSTNCLSCHMKDFNGTTNPKHAGVSAFSGACEQCHSTDNWFNAKFDHSLTGFLLTGGHADPPRACADCHTNNNYNLAGSTCVTCHLTLFQNAKNPDHVGAGFPQTCQDCHTVNAWAPATFDHSKTSFPLTGAHATTPCASCHINNNYQITVTSCVSCHLANFNGAKNPDHVGLGFAQTCQVCHNTTAWQPAIFDHSKTAFPLTGTHITTPCASCHVNNNYNITVIACVSCHQKDFDGATTPVAHTGFPTTCEQCHDTVLWTDAKFDHSTTGFALTGTHLTTPCASCHVNNNYNITVTTCVSCHQKDFNGATTPVNHVGFPTTCEQCHDTVLWTDAKFDHATTGFPLTGFHATTPCASCHINNNYNITVTTCVSCHLADFQGAKNPDHVAGNFAQTCEICHNTSAWQPAAFDHSKSGFPLTGTHITTPCASCHINNNYQITVTTCVSCHQTDYNNATTPVSHTGFPTTCEQCHDTVLWTDGKFDHAATGWPLVGTHLTTPCASCHINNNYNITVTTCVSCHQTDYNNATTPVPHSGFPTTCEQCHDTVLWTDAKFDHSTTGFTLTGTHLTTPCASCHINNNYNITTTTCVSCHQTAYNNAKSPVDHTGFPLTCEQCHDTVLWTDATFNHSTTGFPLTGTHLTTPCASCHINNNYNITVTTCVSCHQAAYNTATTPVPHTGFPTTCEQCHDTVVWTDGKFDHTTTGWALTGTHLTTACALCHVNGNFSITTTTCVSCHQTDYNNAKTPVDHSGFPTTCEQCHDTVLWTDATFNHSTTGFPLTGTHLTTACALCHVNNNYNITVTTCVSCHQAAYNTATTPVPHTGFPTTCENCHDTVVWTDGKFDHSTTGWPLVGTHLTTACALCHVNGNFNITVTTCVSCHQTDYNNAKTPVDHIASGFPTTCEVCHDTVLWTDATFNHSTTTFGALTGAHATTACALCHVNNNYTTLPLTCIGCHQATYNGTTNPGHLAQPTFFPSAQCNTCHTTTAWTPATFNHALYTQFSTGHGNANGVCATCHTNANNYAIFQCTQCHGGNNSANFNHPNVNGYVYNSVNCYQCHSSGGGG